ncbi:transporter substrate-binding domain-containing protein [Pantoea sp. Mb-10]|uniref:ATP-binding protein n=1 Tax=unclassified Pantoea TaxID=2630326 RepID=UPI001E2988F0|nr:MULTISPECIES: ATP-binding protein [unclassified Pantoea]MCE0491274.1 transporter substrate-binding domain-containing protein [Pantoea sp. Mb-10]MCE0502763.1 transporter substrate-binding domain-containing protein [Pantoea sp. Pb-8]
MTLALYGPARPPLVRISPSGLLSGFMADFISTASHSLGLTLKVVHYNRADEAFAALDAEIVDLVFSPAGDTVPVRYKAEDLITIEKANPVVITRRTAAKPVSKAKFTQEEIPARRLAQLDQGTVEAVTLPAVEAWYLIERNYINTLEVSDISAAPMTPYQLVTGAHNLLFSDAMHAAISNLRSSAVGEKLASRWQANDLPRFIDTPINLSPEEKAWLEAHPEISVVSSAFNPPFFVRNPDGGLAGIGPELLSLIGLRTGLHFRYIDISDSRNLTQALDRGEAMMTAPLIWSQERSKDLLLTSPFMFTPMVMVTRSAFKGNVDRAILTPGHNMSSWFTSIWPQAQILRLGNPALAIQQVAQGKADATFTTLINARYIMQGLYRGQLHLHQGLPVADAAIVFGVRHADPELRSILNKTIASLPPRIITDVLAHWQSTPGVRYDTWKIYRQEFYAGVAGALVLIIVTVIWAVMLRQQVRRTQGAKTQLRQEIMFRDRLINGPPRPVYVARSDGEIIHSNVAFKSCFSGEAAEHLNLSLYDIRHPLHEVWRNCMQNPPVNGIPQEAEFMIEPCSGMHQNIRHWITSFGEDGGGELGYIAGWQDVTEYLNMQSALQQSQCDAEHANRAKSHFLAMMSHEIRTPLSAVIGLLELQVQEKRADTELIRVAHESALTLMSLIGDVLDIVRIESGKMVLHPRWSSLEALVRPVVQAFSSLARQKNIILHLDMPDGYEIYTDDNRLRQVIANLISNAVKFTEQGRVHVQVILNEDKLQVIVKDTGCGISEQDQARLFERFEQAVDQTAGGSGLGLAICREIASLMEGTLILESKLTHGSTFTLCIPVQSRAYLQSECIDSSLPTLNYSRNILIVDDHPANLLLISRQLTLLGHQPFTASDGVEGMQIWRAKRPEIIITDCSMPELDGLEMTRLIRKEDQNVVIIGITANAQETERVRCLAAGMNQCLFRPVKLSSLSEAINTYEFSSEQESDLSCWLDSATLASYIPDSPKEGKQFIQTVIYETRNDLQAARKAVMAKELSSAYRLFHRMAGTLRVIGVEKLSDQCSKLEELAEMEEEEQFLLHNISIAEGLLEAFNDAFLATFNNESD